MIPGRFENYESLTADPAMQERIQEVTERWQTVSYEDVQRDTLAAQTFEPREDNSRAIILEPLSTEVDEMRTVVLALPHLQKWQPHHYIRARIMQQIVAPNNRVIVFPNSLDRENPDYDLSKFKDHEIECLRDGDLSPVAERHMSTLEHLDGQLYLGDIALSGYSLGGKTVLAMAEAGSSEFNVTHLNADETPSKSERTPKELEKDFLKSGGIFKLRRSSRDAGLPAMNSARRLDRFAADLAGFGVASKLSDAAKIMHESMAGSVQDLVHEAKTEWPNMRVKMGYVENSLLFDPSSVSGEDNVDLVNYSGPEFLGHTSGDNVILHALMVNDGINRPV